MKRLGRKRSIAVVVLTVAFVLGYSVGPILAECQAPPCGTWPCNGCTHCTYAGACYSQGAKVYVGECPGYGSVLTCMPADGGHSCYWWENGDC